VVVRAKKYRILAYLFDQQARCRFRPNVDIERERVEALSDHCCIEYECVSGYSKSQHDREFVSKAVWMRQTDGSLVFSSVPHEAESRPIQTRRSLADTQRGGFAVGESAGSAGNSLGSAGRTKFALTKKAGGDDKMSLLIMVAQYGDKYRVRGEKKVFAKIVEVSPSASKVVFTVKVRCFLAATAVRIAAHLTSLHPRSKCKGSSPRPA
jgi:hypothetical protein